MFELLEKPFPLLLLFIIYHLVILHRVPVMIKQEVDTILYYVDKVSKDELS